MDRVKEIRVRDLQLDDFTVVFYEDDRVEERCDSFKAVPSVLRKLGINFLGNDSYLLAHNCAKFIF